MITRKHLKGYSDIILEMLGMFSEDTTVKAVNLINTDTKYLKIRKILDKKPTEQEFLKELEKLK